MKNKIKLKYFLSIFVSVLIGSIIGMIAYHKTVVAPVILIYKGETAQQTLSDMDALEYLYHNDCETAVKLIELKVNNNFLILNRMQVFNETDSYIQNLSMGIMNKKEIILKQFVDKSWVFDIPD
ncbi:MAG: hypothetical protein HN729_05355 [Candidatus Marinimicrobia bacterium]|jgi:hypothetical protein|nr:hypothetical protein [Candidatus Neomarinimicrobiota bacterium]MBT3634398.1 hypothetical protein [Candidatus Neomarinimicrobiota bacterium]MBT3681693.1 hypothetical protein [Candidatus Neomarinimicrobiota bacterium]MBT3759419.1 hypothetical protein [Candidatus Neomarinimicrobiota bacterium]MBT3895907.1 hypothetical protein [Candidatus Neomarinimicrobiota bacterium]